MSAVIAVKFREIVKLVAIVATVQARAIAAVEMLSGRSDNRHKE